MHIFKMLDGKTIKEESFMNGPTLSSGFHWQAQDPNIRVETKGDIEVIDPNIDYLFGYESKTFLQKQYNK